MKKLGILLIVLMIVACGCSKPSKDARVNLQPGVGSDTLGSNIVIRPVTNAFNVLTGEGIEVREAVTKRNEAGMLELYVLGYNDSVLVRRFQYKVEWVDKEGLPVDTKTSTWLPMSASPKTTFSIKVVAPRAEAVDFKMDTRKQG
jgi:uncharacterized protein YcfL